jgi:hypothetical protein
MEQQRSAELKVQHEEYLKAHPEVPRLLNDFVTSCLVHQPVDVFDHAREYFATVAPRIAPEK